MLETVKHVYEELNAAFESCDIIYITGKPGCGKSYAISEFLKNRNLNNGAVVFSNTSSCEFEYSPFTEYFFRYSEPHQGEVLFNLIENVSQNIENSKVGILFSLVTGFRNLLHSRKDSTLSIFNDTEKDILTKMRYLCKNKKSVFIFNNINEWDRLTVNFLKKILKAKSYHNFLTAKFIIVESTLDNQTCLDAEDLLLVKRIDFQDINAVLNDGIVKEILMEICGITNMPDSIDSYLPLVRLCNNNYNLINIAVTDGFIESFSISEIDIVKEIVDKRLSDLGAAKNQINEVLEYASVLGKHFTVTELTGVLNKSRAEFASLIEKAANLSLVKCGNVPIASCNSFSFVYDFLQKVFEENAKQHDPLVYTKIKNIIETLYPYDYLRCAHYCLKARDNKTACIYYMLFFMRLVRKQEIIPNELLSEYRLISEGYNWDDFFASYKAGVRSYHAKDYKTALNTFNSIDKFLPKEFQFEVDIMVTLCQTKSLDVAARTSAVCRLSENLEASDDITVSIKERMEIRLIVLYAHLGLTNKAKDVEKQLCETIKFREGYNAEAIRSYRIVNRIANSYYDCEMARAQIYKAVNYFGPYNCEIPKDILQYFNALTNYSGAQCMCGCFGEAFSTSNMALDLTKSFEAFEFPRVYIVCNNYIISGFLSGKIPLDQSLDMYEKLYNEVPKSAERIFYASNLAIFYSLNNLHSKAISFFQSETSKHEITKDPEKIYNYRYITNMASFYLLSGNKKAAKEMILKGADINLSSVPDGKLMEKKLKLLTKLIDSERLVDSGTEFLYSFVSKRSNETPDRYYLLGYTFTTLYNWDID